MAVWLEVEDGEYRIWCSCADRDYQNGHVIGCGLTLQQAKTDAHCELNENQIGIDAITVESADTV